MVCRGKLYYNSNLIRKQGGSIKVHMHVSLPNSASNIAARLVSSILKGEVTLIELTVLYNSPDCLQNARLRKENKELYQHALSNLETKGMVSEFVTIKIGALGHWLPHTHLALRQQISSLSQSTAIYTTS